MSTPEVVPRRSEGSPSVLMATRPLAILDELGMPYHRTLAAAAADQWAELSSVDRSCALLWYVGQRGETSAGWSLGSIRIWGRVAPEEATVAVVDSLRGHWRRESPILDSAGAARAWVWRSREGGTILPFDPDEVVGNLRTERYLRLADSRAFGRAARVRRTYYTVRPLLPRRVQISLRRAYSRIQAQSTFPRWPIEPTLHDLVEFVLQRAADAAQAPVPYIGWWPRGRSWALVLTHDVETKAGRDTIEALRLVEEAAGYRSAWNLVPARYPVPDALIEHLKAVGCEVGLHGLRHDGRDLESLNGARGRLSEMHRWSRRWGAVGFRAPATHRDWDLMPTLGFGYDSSYPDTDPYEPMAGGCCSWLPFLNGDMVELPITLTQDHTLFVILRRDESLWREKAEFLRARGGMALVVVHPDYMGEASRLEAYRRLLEGFRGDPGVWTPLPREVADWWRRRAATSLRMVHGTWRAFGPAADEVAIGFARPGSPARSLLASSDGPRSAQLDLQLAEGPGGAECL